MEKPVVKKVKPKFPYTYKKAKSFTECLNNINEKYKSNPKIYPISEELFNQEVLPIIKKYILPTGRPQKINYYVIFNALLFVLRTGIPWRYLPEKYYGASWSTIYRRFNRTNQRDIWWQILMLLQSKKKITINIVMTDTTTKTHR